MPSTDRYEVWLRPNLRALLFGAVLPLLGSALGLLLLLGLPGREPPLWLRVIGGAMLAFCAAILLALVIQSRLARVAYERNHLLVRLRSGPPIRVPIDVVECFWLGQAESYLPGKQNERTEVASVVIRIADRAAEWRHQEVNPQLGSWCEGYITIRGTWCERLSVDLVTRLNQRLAEVTGKIAPAPTT